MKAWSESILRMRLHPKEYYIYFDDVFGRSRDYKREMQIVSTAAKIRDGIVREIGAGTGNHSEYLLQSDPAELELLDDDPQAVQILRRRFQRDRRVRVVGIDGFSEEAVRRRPAGLSLAMYAILQQVSDINSFRLRLENALKSVAANGCFIFEFIDAEKSREIYPHGHRTLLLDEEGSNLWLRSTYGKRHFCIQYRGKLRGSEFDYSVSLLSISKKEVENLAAMSQFRVNFLPLSADHRKMLCAVKKNAW